MTIENITRYLTKGDLLIVGDREDIQLLALEHNNAILVTGGFQVSDRVKELSRLKLQLHDSRNDSQGFSEFGETDELGAFSYSV